MWIQLGYPKRATELKIVQRHSSEYELSPALLEHVLELVHHTREDPIVESPASIRSSIGLARLAAERARRLGQPVDNVLLAEAARMVMTEAIKLKPGRDVEKYLDSLLEKVLGTKGR